MGRLSGALSTSQKCEPQRRKRPRRTSNQSRSNGNLSILSSVLAVISNNTNNAAAIAIAAARLVVRGSVACSALLVFQSAWTILKTPRLSPPPLSGLDFVREGILVRICDVDDCDDGDVVCNPHQGVLDKEERQCNSQIAKDENVLCKIPEKEFRLVLIGDSPVEGIGNKEHSQSMGGETARAFVRLFRRSNSQHDRVRYWSYGKSGLTARGIEKEMVPLLRHVVSDVRSSSSIYSDNSKEGGVEPAIHAIVLSCGVNNVLEPHSNPGSFFSDIKSLLCSIRNYPGLQNTPLIILGLPDFSRLPFLPWWPLGWILGMKGKRLQKMMDKAVQEMQLMEDSGEVSDHNKTITVKIPEVQDILGTIGYHRSDRFTSGETTNSKSRYNNTTHCSSYCNALNGKPELFQMRLCHPLVNLLQSVDLTQEKLASLKIKDFLCDDGFHPGKYGTILIGSLIAEAYGKSMGLL